MSQRAHLVSATQEGVLYDVLAGGDAGLYVIQYVIRVRGPVDADEWRRAWESAVARHDILRSAFARDASGAARLIVHDTAPLEFATVQTRAVSSSERQGEINAHLSADRRRGFALDEPPMMRLALFNFADADAAVVWTYHHGILDGRAAVLLLYEVMASRDTSASAAAPLVPYEAFAQWSRDRRWSARDIQHRRTIGDLTSGTQIPTDDVPPGPDGTAHVGHVWSERRTAELLSCARHIGVAPSSLVTGAWALTLGALTGSTRVRFGLTRGGRLTPLRGVDRTIGPLSSFVPRSVAMHENLPVADWLRRIREADVALLLYDHMPISLLRPERERSVTDGVFHSVVCFDNSSLTGQLWALGPAARQCSIAAMEVHLPAPLALFVFFRTDGTLKCRLDYHAKRFRATTTRRIVRQFAFHLEQLVAHRTELLHTLPLTQPRERRHLLARTAGAVPPRTPKCLHELFEAQTARTPTRVAVVDETRRITYHELNTSANRLARYLRRRGVGPEVCVAVCLDRSVELLVALLAILKAGGGYVPLDGSHPRERLMWSVTDSRSALVLTNGDLSADFAGIAPVVCLDSESTRAAIDVEPPDPPAPRTVSENLAYVIYTSGSTGHPKGVLVTHGNVTRLFAATASDLAFSEHDVVTLFHSIAFDFSVWELWSALLFGGRLVVVSEHRRRSPPALYELLSAEDVTVLSQTPSAFQALSPEILRGRPPLCALRAIVFGGERLNVASLAEWFARHRTGTPRLINMYGITETTVHVTYRPLRAADASVRSATSPIGRPLRTLRAYVLDTRRRLVPAGAPGELYVGGEQLARGYLNRPGLTAARFVPNPFGPAGSRLYRTGDRVSWSRSGELEFLGRVDRQVKVRGYRVELSEIEHALLRIGDVAEAVAVLCGDRPSGTELVAYVVPTHGVAELDSLGHRLRMALRSTLPDYMVPGAVIVLPSLPFTGNGKVDLRALPAPDTHQARQPDSRLPRTPIETAVARVWTDALGVAHIGVDDDFFALGGHSLLATHVLASINAELGLDLPLRTLFDAPTIASFARRTLEHVRQNYPDLLHAVESVSPDEAEPAAYE